MSHMYHPNRATLTLTPDTTNISTVVPYVGLDVEQLKTWVGYSS